MLWSIYMLDTVWDHALNGRLNAYLRELCQNQLHAKLRLQTIARHMITYIHQFDLGIIHGDFKPGNTAWRTNKKELVIFDLEDMMLDTKFYDAAMILGAPESMSKIDYSVIDDLIELFMNQYTRHSGNPLYFEAFKRELQIVWFTRTLNLWEWLPHELHGPPYQDPEKGKDRLERCDYLFAVLHSLIDQLPVTELLLSQ